MSQITHPVDITNTLNALSSDSGTASKAKAFVDFLATNLSTVMIIAGGAATGQWNASNQQTLVDLLNTPDYKTLESYLGNPGSIAFVVGGEGGVVIGGKGYSGVIYEPANINSPQRYECLGLSIGGTEGAVAFTGMVLNSEDIYHSSGTEFFISSQVDLGVGVACEVFHDLGKNKGMVVLVTTGEELDISGGVAYVKTSHLK